MPKVTKNEPFKFGIDNKLVYQLSVDRVVDAVRETIALLWAEICSDEVLALETSANIVSLTASLPASTLSWYTSLYSAYTTLPWQLEPLS